MEESKRLSYIIYQALSQQKMQTSDLFIFYKLERFEGCHAKTQISPYKKSGSTLQESQVLGLLY